MLDHQINEVVTKLGTMRNTMGTGEGFGERALVDPDGIRTASVVTLKPTEFIIVNRSDFLLIEDKYNKSKILKSQFLMEFVPGLKSINSQQIIDLLIYSIHEKIYRKGSTITTEGSTGQNVYWIDKGDLKLEREIAFQYKEAPTDARKIAKQVKMNISYIGRGCSFGEELLLSGNEQNQYFFTARVHS